MAVICGKLGPKANSFPCRQVSDWFPSPLLTNSTALKFTCEVMFPIRGWILYRGCGLLARFCSVQWGGRFGAFRCVQCNWGSEEHMPRQACWILAAFDETQENLMAPERPDSQFKTGQNFILKGKKILTSHAEPFEGGNRSRQWSLHFKVLVESRIYYNIEVGHVSGP